MRLVHVNQVIDSVENLCITANFEAGEDIVGSLNKSMETEESPAGKAIIEHLLENYKIAGEEKVPICQDCGFAVLFVELGQDVHIEGGNLIDALNEGVRRGYEKGYLRKSIVNFPATKRINTKDNTPAVIHTDIVDGDKIKITFLAKGGGCENMSIVKMLTPADGIEGVKKTVVEAVRAAGSNPCPPIKVGVGIGGTFEIAAKIAKKALLRKVGKSSSDAEMAEVEKELLYKINNLGIGPQGLGGRTTALSVAIETHPCHIASLPMAVNIDCHASRHKEAVI